MVNGALREVPESTQRSTQGIILKVSQRAAGTFNNLSEGLHEYFRDLPRSSNHHDTPEAFSQIFIITYVLTQFSCLRPLHAPQPILRMRRITEQSGAPSVATALRPMVAPRLYCTKWCIVGDPPLLECNRIILVQYIVIMSLSPLTPLSQSSRQLTCET